MDQQTFHDFLFSFWWLIFPVGGMLMGVFAMVGHYNHRKEALKIIKSYADQGKDPPAALLESLRSDEDDYGYYGRRRYRRRYGRGGWSSAVVFAAMAAGFGYANYSGFGTPVFGALAVAFGVAAVFMFIGALIRLATMPKLPPPDDRDPT